MGQVYYRKFWVVPTADHRPFSPPTRENGFLVTLKVLGAERRKLEGILSVWFAR
jgi:hypothetical protein